MSFQKPKEFIKEIDFYSVAIMGFGLASFLAWNPTDGILCLIALILWQINKKVGRIK